MNTNKTSLENESQPSCLGVIICRTLLKAIPFFGVFFVDKVWLQWNFAIYILYQILIGCLTIIGVGYLFGQYGI